MSVINVNASGNESRSDRGHLSSRMTIGYEQYELSSAEERKWRRFWNHFGAELGSIIGSVWIYNWISLDQFGSVWIRIDLETSSFVAM